jgi:murein DD-endopeptidase MepM/ murein hydrolase activator NlpD/inorganic pyrophosphatase
VNIFLAFLLAITVTPAVSLTVLEDARSLRPGELVVLTVTADAALDDVRARGFDRALPAYRVDARTWRVLAGIDLEAKAGTYLVKIEAGPAATPVRATHSLVVQARTFPTRRLTVDEAMVNPPASALPRIAEESKLFERVWSASAPEKLWTDAFIRPVTDPANSAFGTRSILNGVPRNPHSGADFLSGTGTPIKAPNAGRIIIARDLYFSGGTVVIDHGLGVFSQVAHLSAIDVKEGDVVAAGQVVGKVGATGRVTGPHLHWAVRVGGARIDPLSLLAMLGDVPQVPLEYRNPPPVLPEMATSALDKSLAAAAKHVKSVWRDQVPVNADGTLNGYIEIARGDRRKWEFNIGENVRMIDRMMPVSVGGYPVNYGFVPQTVSYDGDPFDVLVLGPAIAGGTLVRGVIVGVMFMEDEKGLDSKVVISRIGADGQPLHQLTPAIRRQIGDYFARYKAHEPGKFSKVPGWGSAAEGLAYVSMTRAFFTGCRGRTAGPCPLSR